MEPIDKENLASMTTPQGSSASSPSQRKLRWLVLLLTPLAVLYIWNILIAPPAQFLPHTYLEIPKGYTLSEVSVLLKERSIIRSETIFLFTIQRADKETGIQSGIYFFKDPVDVFEVASRITRAEYGIKQVKVTLPEGITINEMSLILSKTLPAFDANKFIANAVQDEGYLFPDTYFFYTNATSGPIILAMKDNFTTRTQAIRNEAELLKKNFQSIVIIASILEEEATTARDREIVSGIIWKRLEKNMPLQVDATLGYITGKGSLQLTTEDLRKDSPFNTYTHRGLPPSPISNPGLESLSAALHPVNSPYWYYLSDKDGVIHYAKTFEEHKLNKARYLR